MYLVILSNSLDAELSSIIFTIDEPMMTPSEHLDSNLASSDDLIPKPARVGTEAYFFISLIFGYYPIEHKTALMVAAAPSGVMSYMLALNYKVPVTVIAPIIFYTSIGSLLTISFVAGF